MDVVILNSNNFVSLSANYNLDSQISLKKDYRSSYSGINLTLDECLSSARDTSSNKYSNFYLSNEFKYDNFLSLDSLTLGDTYTFTTYIAINSSGGLNNKTRYLNLDIGTPEFSNGYNYNFVENLFVDTSYFEIEFLENNKCTISNEYEFVKRYFSYDYLSNSFKFISAFNSELNEFNYSYDKNENLLTLSKKIYDKENYLTFDIITSLFTFVSASSGTATFDTFSADQILKLRNNNSTLGNNLSSSNYVYKKPYNTGELFVDLQTSTYDYNSNYLFNNEFYSIKPYKKANLDLNLINLKNQKTVNNDQSYGGVFINEPQFKHRYYENIFTGVNQEKGNYNIGLGFASYTISKKLKPDTLSYFHIPYDIYPYGKLNVNDSSLVISGAIPSDTPYFADKIFKKLGNYKYSSPFGNTSDTQTGDYLCTWLSGSDTINEKGIWVDRYYDPANISYYDALVNPSNDLTTNFDTASANSNIDNKKYDLFDKISDLTFEKGALYAYHHIGKNNATSFVNSMSGSLIFDNFDYYYDKDYFRYNFNKEITFNGNYFCKALETPLDSVSKFDNLSINFDLKIEDVNKPIGSQIIGNYSDRGLGIFNYRRITPHTITFAQKEIYIYNSNGRLLHKVFNDEIITNIVRNEPNGNFFVFDETAKVTKYTYIGGKIEQKYIPEIDNENNTNYYSFGKYIFIINGNDWYRLDTTSFIIKSKDELNYETVLLGENNLSIAATNNKVILTPGVNTKVHNNNVYYYEDFRLKKYNITTKETLTKLEVITLNDYTIDEAGTVYGIYENNKVFKINDRDFNEIKPQDAELSNYTGLEFGLSKKIDVINEFYNGELNKNLLTIYSLSANRVDNVDLYRTVTTKIDTDFLSPSSFADDILTSSSSTFDNNSNINNFNYVYNNYDDGSTLSVKVRLPQIYDVQTYEEGTLSLKLSSIGPGYHNFTVSLDTTNGLFNLLVDGANVDTYTFQNAQYSFGTLFSNQFFIGTEPSYGNNKLNENLKDNNYYNYSNFTIKDFYLYNKPLYLYETANIIRSKEQINDLYFQLPTGKRSYVENIDKYFKFKLPGRKSNQFNVKILDTGITEEVLQKNISNNINENITSVIPANTRLNNIEWEVEND